MTSKLVISQWTAHLNMLLSSYLNWCGSAARRAIVECSEGSRVPVNAAILQVEGLNIFFDYSDGYELSRHGLECDFYFKRSLLLQTDNPKVLPLGLHFNYSDYLVRLVWRRGIATKRNVIEVLRSADLFRLSNMSHFDMKVSDVFARPSDFGGRVIFFTRLWDPSRNDDPEETERRMKMNQTRIDLVRALRRLDNAVSGIYPDEFAARQCPDLLLRKSQTTKRNYMRSLRRADIGIANEGLKGAPGWKIGEYVAGAKAVITNEMCSVVPGFREGDNYLRFDEAGSVLDLVSQLRAGSRYKLMQEANFEYATARLHPTAYLHSLLAKIVPGVR